MQVQVGGLGLFQKTIGAIEAILQGPIHLAELRILLR